MMTEQQIKKNRELVERYPFLTPRYAWSGKIIEDYDYSFTMLDDMPDGWRTAFGEQMCEEIRDVLVKLGKLNDYRVLQIKEKFGQLRWYNDSYCKELEDVIDKYTALSERTCIVCGKPAEFVSTGWISPWCGECADKFCRCGTIPIDAFYKEDL